MIRIQGGRFKGRRLLQPGSLASRPSSAKLRSSLFSLLGEDLTGSWADLFCGVGGFGIEAIGRGAEHCSFVELEPAALRALASNLELLKIEPAHWRIHRGDARRWLTKVLEEAEAHYDGIFADPPYGPLDPGILLPVGWRLVESGRARAFILEHAAAADLPLLESSQLCTVRTRHHGGAAFTIIEGGSR